MRNLWVRTMTFFVVAFYAFLFVSGLLAPRGASPEAAAEKAGLVRTLQEKEQAAREHLLADPDLLDRVSSGFVLVLSAGLTLLVWAFSFRARRGRWPVLALDRLEPRWGVRDVLTVLVFALFVEACFFFLQVSARLLLDFYGDPPDTLLILTSLLRDLLVLGFVWAAVRAGSRQGREALGLRFDAVLPHAVTGLLAYLALIPVLLALFALMNRLMQLFSWQPEPQAVVQMYLKPASEPYLLPLTFFVAVLGPVMEETLFRGFAYGGLRRRLGVTGAAVVTSLAFAFLHLNWAALVPVFLLGMVLAYLYEHSGSLVPSMTLHVLHNVVMVALTLGFKELAG